MLSRWIAFPLRGGASARGGQRPASVGRVFESVGGSMRSSYRPIQNAWRPLLPCLAITCVAASAPPVSAATYQVGPGRSYTNLQAVAPLLGPGDLVEVDGNA